MAKAKFEFFMCSMLYGQKRISSYGQEVCLFDSADDDNDDLFDDPTPSRYSQYKDAADDYSANDYKSVERSRSSASVEEQTSPTRRTRRAKPIDLGAAASYGKDSDSKVCHHMPVLQTFCQK